MSTELEKALENTAANLEDEVKRIRRDIQRLQKSKNPDLKLVASTVLSRLHHLSVNADFNQIVLAVFDDLGESE